MFFIDPNDPSAPSVSLNIPKEMFEGFRLNLEIERRAHYPDVASMGNLGIKIEVQDGEAVVTYPPWNEVANLVLLAAAKTDSSLIGPAAKTVDARRNNMFISHYPRAWVDYLKGGGVPISLETFNGIEHRRACGVAHEKLVPVDGCNVENGVWVRVTGREAAALATGLGQTGVWSWIDNRFSGSAEEGDIRPEFYLLVDDPAAPTRAHVTLAAARSCDLEGGGEVRGIAALGHATGFMNKNPYPDYAQDIEALVEAEGLTYQPNWMGELIEEPACEGPTM